jgi:hypothetical protein
MGTLQQQTQRKPAMVILTEIVRVTMPAARRPEATEESTPLLRPGRSRCRTRTRAIRGRLLGSDRSQPPELERVEIVASPLLRLGTGEHSDVAATIIIEVFNPPIPCGVAVFDDGDLPMKRAAHRNVLEALSVRKPRLIGWVLGSCGFLEGAGLVRHAAFSHTISRTGYRFDGSTAEPGTREDTFSMQPKLTAEEIHLLRQLTTERDRQVLGGMARPPAADGLQALGYVEVRSLNSQDLLFTITPAGRAALAAIDAAP